MCAPVGGRAPSGAARVITASAEGRSMFHAGERVSLTVPDASDLQVGQRYFVRRAMTFRGAPVAQYTIGRVAIIDIPDLDRPQNARLVARLGARQGRDARQGTSLCQETSP